MMEKSAKNYLKKALVIAIPILAFVLIFVLRMCAGTIIAVSGRSMEPTFATTDYVLVSRVHDASELKVGDIVILVPDSGSCKGERLIKRLVALPNTSTAGVEGAPEMELGDNEYYVMGDNRFNSIDSRSFGPVGAEEITYRYIGVKVPEIAVDAIIVLFSVSVVAYYYICYEKQRKVKAAEQGEQPEPEGKSEHNNDKNEDAQNQ